MAARATVSRGRAKLPPLKMSRKVRLPSVSAPPRPATLTAPAAAPAYVPQPDPQFGADVNSANLNLSTTLQHNQAARGQLGTVFGLGVDAAGNTIDDHTNPFSRAAALQTSYDNSVRGTQNSYAARGQLYSGAIQEAQTWNARQNLQSRDNLVRSFMGARQRLDDSDLGAKNAYSSAVSQAQAVAAQRALDEARSADTSAVDVGAWQQMAAQHAAAQLAAARPAATPKLKPTPKPKRKK